MYKVMEESGMSKAVTDVKTTGRHVLRIGGKKVELSKLIITVLLGLCGIAMVVPFMWMISTSLKYEVDVFNFPIEWIPKRIRAVENYKDVWTGKAPFAMFYLNSFKVTIITTVVTLFVSCLGGYGFSRVNFKGRDKIFLLYIATMVIPDQVTLLPRFMITKWLGVFDTHSALVINSMFSITTVFLIRQYMLSIPFEFSESARIDGAGHFRIFWHIIMPLTKPAVATLAILKFIWTWNDYQNPLIFITDKKLYTIQLGMKMFSDQYGEYYSLMMAAAVSAIIPLFIVFFLGQKYIYEGISLGGVKG